MRETARPRKEIDAELFENLCSIFCTREEIAHVMKCTEPTIRAWCKRHYGMGFEEAFEKFSADGRISLRRIQMQHAEKSAAMAIFLGKNYLGQRDVPESEQAAPDLGILKELTEALNRAEKK